MISRKPSLKERIEWILWGSDGLGLDELVVLVLLEIEIEKERTAKK